MTPDAVILIPNGLCGLASTGRVLAVAGEVSCT